MQAPKQFGSKFNSKSHLQIQTFPPYRHMDQKYEVSRIKIEAQLQRNGKGIEELTGRTSRTGSTKSPDNWSKLLHKSADWFSFSNKHHVKSRHIAPWKNGQRTQMPNLVINIFFYYSFNGFLDVMLCGFFLLMAQAILLERYIPMLGFRLQEYSTNLSNGLQCL